MPKIVHTIGANTYEYEVPVGTTPMDFVMEKNPETNMWQYPTVCMFEGQFPLQAQWGEIALETHDIVYFCEYPLGGGGGGGSNPLRMIASIFIGALAVAAAVFTGGLSIFATMPALGAFAGAVVGSAVMMGGQLLMGALTRMPKNPTANMDAFNAGASSPTYSWNPTGNQARMFQFIPEQFGRMKVTPDYITKEWSMYLSSNAYVYLTYGLGKGEYDVHQIYMGETLFWEDGSIVNDAFAGSSVQITPPGQPVTLFPSNVETSYEVAGQELYAQNVQPGYKAGPFPLNSPGTVCDRAIFDIILPNGVGFIDDEGNFQAHILCQFVIAMRRIDDEGAVIGDWFTIVYDGANYATRDPVRISYDRSFAAGRYEVIAWRPTITDLNLAGRIMDTVVWAGMKAILPGNLVYDQTALALVVKVTNTLSQSATGNLSVIQTRKLPTWDRYSRSWSSPRVTRSFADAVAYLCKSKFGGALTDRQIDLDKLYEIGDTLDQRGWTLDTWVDGSVLVREILDEWCGCFTVIPRLAGTVLSFTLEAPNRPARADFNPQNIIRDTMSETYATRTDESPDDILISYFDEEYGYVGRDVRCVLPDSRSVNPVTITLNTIVKRDHAHAIGIYRAQCNAYRRVSRTFETEGLGRLLTIGDIVNVHWPLLDTCATIPVSDWDESGLLIKLAIDLSTEDIFTEYTDLYLLLTDQYGKGWGPVRIAEVIDNRILRMDAADFASVVFSLGVSPFTFITSGNNSQPTMAIVQKGTTTQFRMMITDVTHLGEFRFRISGVEDRPEVYVQNIPVPPWEFRQQLPSPGEVGTPYGIFGTFAPSSEGFYRLILGWQPVSGAQRYIIEAAIGSYDYSSQGQSLTSSTEMVIPEGPISVRVAAIRNDMQGGWGFWSSTTVNIVPNAPKPELVAAYEGTILKIKWETVYAANRYNVAIYRSGAGSAIRNVGTTTLAYEYPKSIAKQDGGPYRSLRIAVTAINSTGTSIAGNLDVSDPAPEAVLGVVLTVDGTSVTISSNVGTGEVTGYIAVLLFYDKFDTPEDVKAYQIVAEPTATFTGLAAGPQYLAIAAKDSFFDAVENPLDLNWSRIYMTTITG